MGQISGLITGKLETLADAHDQDALLRKRKAISALFPYAVWQERDKEYPIFDVFLRIAKTAYSVPFWWRHIEPFIKTLLGGTSRVSSNRALLLLSPCVPWDGQDFWEDRARKWAAAASTVPKEEDIAPSVVDTLLQIASRRLLQPVLHMDAWSWLTLLPSLPPVCEGRERGSRWYVVQMVRDLKDIEILKSYLLLIWSEWDTTGSIRPESDSSSSTWSSRSNCDSIRSSYSSHDSTRSPCSTCDSTWSSCSTRDSTWWPCSTCDSIELERGTRDGYSQMKISIREDFSGIKMSSHRADLLQRLDYVLGQLDRGLEHFQQEYWWLAEDDLQKRKDQYGRLREILLEVDQEALEVLTRASPRLTALVELPTHAAARRITFDVHVCASYRLTIADLPPPFVSVFGYRLYIDTRPTFALLTTSKLSLCLRAVHYMALLG